MNSQSAKDFAWYRPAQGTHTVEKIVYPTQSFEAKPAHIDTKPYNQILSSTYSAAKQHHVQEPTIISIESTPYTAPINVISVEHSIQKPALHHARLDRVEVPKMEKAVFIENPIYETVPSTNISLVDESNTTTSSSLLEETEPLLDHSSQGYGSTGSASLTDNLGLVDDMGLTDTLGASELQTSTGFSDNTLSLDREPETFGNSDLDSGLDIMKRNSIKLDSLNLQDNDLETGAKFDSDIADLVNLDYKGETPADFSEYKFSETDDMILENDKWNFFYARRTPGWIVEAEEQERLERTRRGMDPILMGKWHRIQKEFMLNKLGLMWSEPHPSKVMERAEHVKETVVETAAEVKEAVVESIHHAEEVMHESFTETSSILSGLATGLAHSVASTSSYLVGSVKDTLGLYEKGSIKAINALEEKERMSRLNQKHDPIVEARKRHVELELMNAIKPAC